ncbi:MAG: peptidylprolyl isomerase [Planctomycetes bacterium]|nr:peptidylprolyl isomerase [Planctomycetota bacterium]
MILAAWAAFAACGVSLSQAQNIDATAVTAEIRAWQSIVLIGSPIWVDFTLHNPTDQVAILFLKGSRSLDLNVPEMGLPLEHVIDRGDAKALVVLDHDGREIDFGKNSETPAKSIAVRLAPQASVGLRIDVSKHCSALRKPGKYKLQWRPYDGAIQSNTINIRVGALKQARFETDYGPMTIEFFYEDAPRHVENFLELAESGFYDNLTFHRIVEGYLIQGGAPDGEPDAIRSDGKRLEPEFNDRQFTKGTVAMARRRSDPNSASCQFFICGSRRAEWDGVYTAFGQLVGEESFATLEKLMGLAVGKHDRPRKKVYIRAVRTQDLTKAE